MIQSSILSNIWGGVTTELSHRFFFVCLSVYCPVLLPAANSPSIKQSSSLISGRQRPIRGGEGSGTGESAITPAKQPTSESAPPTSRSGSKPSSGQGQDQASAGKQPPSTPGKTDDQDKNKPASASAAAAGDKSGQDTTDSGKNKPADTKSADANGKPNAPASDAADKPAEEKPKEPAKAPPPILKGEISAKTTFSRSAKGPLQVSECSSDGKFVVVENTGKKVGLTLS